MGDGWLNQVGGSGGGEWCPDGGTFSEAQPDGLSDESQSEQDPAWANQNANFGGAGSDVISRLVSQMVCDVHGRVHQLSDGT